MNKFNILTYELKLRIKNYNEKVHWAVFLLLVVFTTASWIDINGMWCELPLMVNELPERWRLPSILTLAMQIAQIGPFLFILFKCLFPKRISFVFSIYMILAVGALSCLLLYFFWNTTVIFANEKRSIALYILTCSLGLLDGTSTVTFLAYIGTTFRKEYIIPNYIGESLSAMIPSIAGIIQGVGEDHGCRNVSVNLTTGNISIQSFKLERIPLKPRFSVSIYFIFLFVVLTISAIAFTMVNYLPVSKREKIKKIQSSNKLEELDGNCLKVSVDIEGMSSKDNVVEKQEEAEKPKIPSKKEQMLLQAVTAAVTFIVYGILPGIQSYSTLPYGNNIFHLSINLSFFFLPFFTFLSIWSYKLSTRRILVEFSIATALSVYIIVMATFSPCPPMLNTWIGPTLILAAWIMSQNIFMRVRCCIATKLEVCGEHALLLIGGSTMFGQFVGGVLMYIIVDTYRLFREVPECVSIHEYCLANNY